MTSSSHFYSLRIYVLMLTDDEKGVRVAGLGESQGGFGEWDRQVVKCRMGGGSSEGGGGGTEI